MDAEFTLNSAAGGPATPAADAAKRPNLRVQPSILYLLSAFLMLAFATFAAAFGLSKQRLPQPGPAGAP
ncbi:MAG: hypothetical protein AMXMBFR7_48370 [Planctomycetota bacterium]